MKANSKNALIIAIVTAFLAVPVLLPVLGHLRLIITDNDSLYHLHRVKLCLENYPNVLSKDMFSHFPDGIRIHWPAACSFVYASIAKVVGFGAASYGLPYFLSWLPILSGMLAAFLVSIGAWRLFPSSPCRWLATAGLTLCSVSFYLIFQYGRIDHHQFSSLGLLVSLMALLLGSPILWAACFFIQFLMTPEALFFSSIIMACFSGMELWKQGGSSRTKPSILWHFAPALAAFLALLLNRAVETEPLPFLALSWQGVSLFQPLWMLFLGVISFSLSWRFHSLPLENNRKLWWKHLIISAIAVLLLGALFLAITNQLQPLLGRFFVKRGITVNEETCPLRYLLDPIPWYLINFFLIPWSLFRFWQCLRDESSSAARLFFGLLVIAGSLLAYYENRFFLAFGVLLTLPLADLLCSSASFVWTMRVLPRASTRRLAQVSLFLIAFAAALTFSFQLRFFSSPVREKRQALMTAWIGESGIKPKIHDHSKKPDYGILGPWHFGHVLHVLCGQPVVVDPFNHIDVPRIMGELYQAKAADELKKVLERYEARYLLVSYPQDSVLNADASIRNAFLDYSIKHGGLYPKDLRQSAYFRLYISGGFGMEFPFLQLRYLAPAKISTPQRQSETEHYPELLSMDMIFELKPGAKIVGHVPPGTKTVQVSFVVIEKFGQEESFYEIRHIVKPESSGNFVYQTSLPIPVTEKQFRIEGGYKFSINGKVATIAVPQEAVDKGETLLLNLEN